MKQKVALPPSTRVRERMSKNVEMITLQTKINEACAVFWKKGINHIPVTDNGSIVGMFSTKDAINMFQDRVYSISRITKTQINELLDLSEFITSDTLYTIEEHEPITKAKKLMTEAGISSLLVYKGHEMVGIITLKDIE